jgi:hypothetical protein
MAGPWGSMLSGQNLGRWAISSFNNKFFLNRYLSNFFINLNNSAKLIIFLHEKVISSLKLVSKRNLLFTMIQVFRDFRKSIPVS